MNLSCKVILNGIPLITLAVSITVASRQATAISSSIGENSLSELLITYSPKEYLDLTLALVRASASGRAHSLASAISQKILHECSTEGRLRSNIACPISSVRRVRDFEHVAAAAVEARHVSGLAEVKYDVFLASVH
jgi:hypothetical protein